MAAAPPPDKRDAVERLLPHGPALVRFDPRRPGVDVPPGLAAGPVLALKVSRRFANPLTLDDDGLRQRLSFPDGPHTCVVPWAAVFAVGPDGRDPSWLWPEALPPELGRSRAEAPEPDPEPEPPPRGRPQLRLVK